MKNIPDFEQNPIHDDAHEAALQEAGDRLFAGYVPTKDYDDIEFGEEFDESGDLIELTDEELEEYGLNSDGTATEESHRAALAENAKASES